MFSRLATVLQELSGEESPDGDPQVREQHTNTPPPLQNIQLLKPITQNVIGIAHGVSRL